MQIKRSLLTFLSLLPLTFAQTPPQSIGSITGTVFDGVNGTPISQANIELVSPRKVTVSDLDGKFKLDVPPGTYEIRITAPKYLVSTISNIDVTAGQSTDASTVLASSANVTKVEVTETVNAVAASVEAMVAERRLAPSVSDAVSGDEIRKGTASDAAGAVEKVTGVSVVGDGYVYVRGLGERYSTTMLNNALIPTTEPERRVVPLDLFPAALIDNIKVLKSYTPDLPGEFSGGLVQMSTVEFPTQKVLRVSASVGVNTQTTGGKPFLTHKGGSRDIFGFDDGSRNLPSIIPTDDRIIPGRYTPEQVQEFGRSFSNDYTPTMKTSMRPTQTYNIAAGNTYGRLGVIGAITFTSAPQRYQEMQNYLTIVGGGQPGIFTSYPFYEADNEATRLGGVLNAAVKLNDLNKIIFRNTLTHESEKESRFFEGRNGGIDNTIRAERLRWVERGLFSTGVEGDHVVPRLGNSIFNWQFTYSLSHRDEPDLRETVRGRTEDGAYNFLPLPESGFRFFNYLDDKIYEPQGAWSKPFYKGAFTGILKLGTRITLRDRDFNARRFRYVPIRTSTLDFSLPTDEIFAPENIRPDGLVLREITRGSDTYKGDMDVYAGFAQIDMSLGGRWRVVGGLRVEDANINVTTIDPLVPGAVPVRATLANRDYLPGINVIYALTGRQNLRVGYGRTVNRPDFRELSPFDFQNVLGGFDTAGNPNLRRALIDNVDARWEWFLGGDQLIAASYFYKKFDSPIEVTLQPTGGNLRQSFLNADGAQNQGLELEFRRNLRFISPRISNFAVTTNFTFVDSNVEIPESEQLILTSRERPLLGQSRYIFNLITDWAKPKWRSSARFYLNTVSSRITDVGSFGLPDVVQDSNIFLDFVYQFDISENGRWSIRFSAENLSDNLYRWTQGDFTQRQYRLGRTFTVGTSFSIF